MATKDVSTSTDVIKGEKKAVSCINSSKVHRVSFDLVDRPFHMQANARFPHKDHESFILLQPYCLRTAWNCKRQAVSNVKKTVIKN